MADTADNLVNQIATASSGVRLIRPLTRANSLRDLPIVLAAIVVVGLILWLLSSHQVAVQRDKVRVNGLALTRALASIDLSQLIADSGKSNLANRFVRVQDNDSFAYVVVDAKSGEQLFESVSAGSLVPAASAQPSEPSAWFGEQSRISPGDGRKIREFFGPVLKQGDLAGFVRVGYYDTPQNMVLAGDVSYIASLSLPVFLLAAFFFILIRRETRPIALLSQKMDKIAMAYGVGDVGSVTRPEMSDFVQRFEQFMQLVQSKARELDQQSLATQTSSRLVSYRQERANAVLEAMPDALLILDGSSVPTYANSKIEPLFGLCKQKVIGVSPQQWCGNKEVLEYLMHAGGQAGGITGANHMEYSPEGHPDRRIAVSAFPLFSPRDETTLLGTLVLFRDASDEYHARQAGAEFVSHVAHELKTPLSNISGYSELLLDYAALDESMRVNAVNVIRDETERAAGLIGNLLNISKLESGAMPLQRQRVRIHDLLRDAAESLGRNAASKGVSLELKLAPDLGSARLDKDLFRIALVNLLGNAIKYSDRGGLVTLSAENLDNQQVMISVQDEGIGISPEDLGRLFEKYYRSSDTEVSERTGHGLGLSLAKQIVDLHNGTLSVSSELRRGSEFTIRFPAQTQHLEE